MSEFGNYCLEEISASISDGLDPAGLRNVFLRRGQIIGQPGVPLQAVYFPQAAMVSASVEFSSGSSVGGVLIGSEGVFGAAKIFGIRAPVFTTVVQRAGTCWLMPISELRRLARGNHQATAALFRYQHFLVAQAQQIAACAAKHDIRERLCSYFLRVMDNGKEIRTTQEQLACILGVRRTSISMVASELQADGIIRSHRGRIFISDSDRLRDSACECHAAVEHFINTLLPPTADVESTVEGHANHSLSYGAMTYE